MNLTPAPYRSGGFLFYQHLKKKFCVLISGETIYCFGPSLIFGEKTPDGLSCLAQSRGQHIANTLHSTLYNTAVMAAAKKNVTIDGTVVYCGVSFQTAKMSSPKAIAKVNFPGIGTVDVWVDGMIGTVPLVAGTTLPFTVVKKKVRGKLQTYYNL